jgi:hypothetical protein
MHAYQGGGIVYEMTVRRRKLLDVRGAGRGRLGSVLMMVDFVDLDRKDTRR